MEAAYPQDFHRRKNSGRPGAVEVYYMTVGTGLSKNAERINDIILSLGRDKGAGLSHNGIVVVASIDHQKARDTCYAKDHAWTNNAGPKGPDLLELKSSWKEPKGVTDRWFMSIQDGSMCRLSIERRLANNNVEILLSVVYTARQEPEDDDFLDCL